MAQDQAKKNEPLDLVDELSRQAAPPPLDAPGATETKPSPLPPPLPTFDTFPQAAEPDLTPPPVSDAPPPAPPNRLPPALAMPALDAPAATAPPLPRAAPPEVPLAATVAAPAGSAADQPAASERRTAKRRAAMPSRDQIAANDDAPSIGGLIYALNQKPSRKPFTIATFASLGWAVATLGYAAWFWSADIVSGAGLAAFLGRPELLTLVATLLGPIGLMLALALIAYRAEEMRLRSSAMTEVAVRLAEPDRMAEQSVASLGQAVRRQVSFMNDAVGRALGRAGELEALVHSEVAALERSYADNERKIRGLIQELVTEREALASTGDRFSTTLRSMSAEVPELIETLSSQQIKLAKIIEGANQNLSQLESAMAVQTGQMEQAVESRAVRLQEVLGDYTHALSNSLDQRMEQIGTAIASRTGDLQIVFEEYTRALDSTLDNRAQSIGHQLEAHTSRLDERLGQHANTFLERTAAIDGQLRERTQQLDSAFNERLQLFDEAILRSTTAIDSSINEKTHALTNALDSHARSLGDALARQSLELDESLLQGINAVRRTSENITRQSIKALEGLAGQSELLQSVSDNLLGQINTIANRFDGQSQQIMRAANALETANYKIDKTLQARHTDLSQTLDRLSGKADEFNDAAKGYTRQIEGSLTEAESRARQLTAELAQTTEERSRSAIEDIERFSTAASDTTTRALEDLRSRFSNVSREVSQGFNSLTSQVAEGTTEARRRAAEAAAALAQEQERLRAQTLALPDTTRESADAMRRVLQDHLRAIDELSTLSRREASSRDVTRPLPPTQPPPARPLVPIAGPPPAREDTARSLGSLSAALGQEMQARQRPQAHAPAPPPPASPYQAPPPAQPTTVDAREGWSLGDLLKRASADDEAAQHASAQAPVPHAPAQPHQDTRGGLDFSVAARALDPATAAAIWQRLGTGQRGIMVRSIYTAEGRALFDETVNRFRTDPSFAETTQQYLIDFERLLQDADRQDPSGASAQGHLRSDYGRVYLFLAHASGRIS